MSCFDVKGLMSSAELGNGIMLKLFETLIACTEEEEMGVEVVLEWLEQISIYLKIQREDVQKFDSILQKLFSWSGPHPEKISVIRMRLMTKFNT
jgi:hypothetical protein